ncbi:MAG: UDP-3-O-acyl-N-acetylglucosamine deacetylase [Geminicoccaceae bacterium]
MAESSRSDRATQRQRTLRTAIGCVGVGLHSGARVALTLHPAPVYHGIRFRRGDRPGTAAIPARVDNVVDTHLCTSLGLPGGPRVAAVEHIMAAFAACAIDNVLVEVSGPEVPAMDGSAQPFAFLIECAGVVEQAEPRPCIEILKPVSARSELGWAALEPHAETILDCRIEHHDPVVGTQQRVHRFSSDGFRGEIAGSRAFLFVDDAEAASAAKGGVIVAAGRIVNDDGLRFRDEYVRHRILDVVGDLYLAGAPVLGRFVDRRADHRLTSQLLRTLLADASAWRWLDGLAPADTADIVRTAARA